MVLRALFAICPGGVPSAEGENAENDVGREQTPGGSKPKGNLLSNLFLALAVLFAIVAVLLFVRGPGLRGVAPVPTAAPGGNQVVNVTDALRAEGLDVQQPPGVFIPIGTLKSPGQGIEIDGNPAFIFLYPDAAAAAADAASVDPNNVVPARLKGTPVPAGERRLAQGSNVLLVMIGGSSETWQKVEAAIANLP